MLMLTLRLAFAALLLAVSFGTAVAAPARIIVLRHGEKLNKWKLCDTGQERADALAATYLGKGASKSLFGKGVEPVFVAITLHTLELLAPSAESRSAPIMLFSVVSDFTCLSRG